VDLAPYFISKYELTQGQWLRMTGKTPARFKPGETVGGHVVHLGYPVDQVGAQEADTILARLELALPSESQWEQAARGGTSTAWWTGADKASLAGAANLADRYCMLHGGPRSWRYEEGLDDGFAAVAPTGSFRPNAFGLHDVAGNVWEWTTGRMENKGEGTGSRLDLRPGETLRVARGGAWDGISWRARSAHRRNIAPGLVGNVGMRPVRSVPSPEGSLGSVRPGSSASPTAREGSEP
jgi:formylglycine-generating enzyme required for sulfatase activity